MKTAGEFIPDFSFLAPIRIDGPDAAGFLHGQFTTDVAGLASGEAQFSAWCDPRGRAIATFILARLDETFRLLLPEALRQAFLRRLEMYVLRAEVTIADESDRLARAALVDVPAEEMRDLFPGLGADADGAIVQHEGYILVSGPAGERIVLAGKEKTAALTRACESRLSGATSHAWHRAAIRRGIPWLVEKTGGRFLPQELSLDTLGALSYDKGCYPGQEIIARLRYRGRVKRRLCHASAGSGTRLEPGAALTLAGEENTIGTVLNSTTAASAGQELLLVLDQTAVDAGSVVAKGFPDWPVDIKGAAQSPGRG